MRMPSATYQKLQENVDRGAKRLDQRRPNWYKQIDTKTLDLSLGCQCVIGQIYGQYDDPWIKRAIGYVWFHDLVDFIRAKVLFRIF